jgi:hypothetical protein
MAWTDERDGFITSEFLIHHRSASQIARKPCDGAPREAVCGNLYRPGVCRPDAHRVRAFPRGRQCRAPTSRTRRRLPALPKSKTPVSQLFAVPELTGTSMFIVLLATGVRHCRWIVGWEDVASYVCGRNKPLTGAFGADHAALAYPPPKRSSRKAK